MKDSTRNITFNLPIDLIQRTKVHAALRGTSVNELVRQELERFIGQDSEEAASVRQMLGRTRKSLSKIPQLKGASTKAGSRDRRK